VKFQVEVFWVVVVVGYQRFRDLCCLHRQREDFTLKMEAALSSETLVSYISARSHNPEDLDLNLCSVYTGRDLNLALCCWLTRAD